MRTISEISSEFKKSYNKKGGVPRKIHLKN